MNTFEAEPAAGSRFGRYRALSLGVPGMVMGSDKLDASGNAVAAEKSCIFVLLCGGPSHIDTWDMKPNAPSTIRGPYKPISTKVPGMRINEMHTELAKLTDEFTLINSMAHPGSISNHFDAMHNLLSGESAKRVDRAPDEQPYLGSWVAKYNPSKRNIVSNAWLIKCVGPPVLCADIGLGGYIGLGRCRCSSARPPIIRRWTASRRRRLMTRVDPVRLARRAELLASIESDLLNKDRRGADWSDCARRATRP